MRENLRRFGGEILFERPHLPAVTRQKTKPAEFGT